MLVLRRIELRRALPPAVLRTRSIGAALACVLLASGPAFAQIVQQIDSEQTNSAPFENIETIIFQQSNAELDANINTAPITEFLLQSALISQSNSVASTIAIDGGGDVVVNQLITGSQRNGENLTNLNDSVPPISVIDSFTQSAEVNQSNAIASNIAVENSGHSSGIFAAITNAGITQNNRSVISTDNGGDVTTTNSFTQSAKTTQSNKISSSIAVKNSGHVEAPDTGSATDAGIAATIENRGITQNNSNDIRTNNSGDVTADSFTQSAAVTQSNEITSSIAVENSGHVEGNNIGIAATIINGDITQANDNEIHNNSTGDVTASNALQSIQLNQLNKVDGSSIVITNKGVVEGGNVGILAAYDTEGTNLQPNTTINQNFNVSGIPQSIVSTQDNIFGTNDTISISNSGKVFGGPNSDSVFFGGNFGILAVGPLVDVTNTGLVHAFAQGSDASATGIGVIAAEMTITNRAGTIWAGISTDGGSTIQRGLAIDTDNIAGLIQLQGTGHIYGDINIASGNTIEVTEGKTFFDGTINGADGTLDIFDGGKLVLCQEGWTEACDPKGWSDANWDPQQRVDGPSSVFIDTVTIETDGAIAYQLTPRTATGTYPQVFANTANLGGTLEAQYLPGFYANKSFYDDIIVSGGRFGTFDNVEDNSLFLKATAIYDGNNVDLSVKRTPFNKIGGLTKNEKSAAGGIERVFKKLPGPGVNPATTNTFDQFVASLFTINNKTEFSTLLDQLSGAQFAQELQSVLWSLRPFNEAITDRMDCSLNHSNIGPVAGGYNDKSLGAYQPDGCFVPGQWQTWARVWGGWNNNDGDANAPGYNESQWAIWGGADYAISETFFLGAAGGFFRSDNMDFDKFGGVAGGSIEYDGGQVAGYGGWDNRVWYDRAIVSGGFYDGESHRDFAFRAPAVDPSGSPDANVVSFYNEAGRRFGVWTNVTLTPFAGITVAHAELDSFTENDKNNTGIGLKVSGDDADSVASILGLRFNGSWGPFKPQVALGWEHEFHDTFQTVNVSFVSAPSGSKFRVIGTDLGEDALVVDAGASYAVGAANDFSVRYVGRFLEEYDAQSVMGRWTYKFGAAPLAAPPPPVTNRPFK